MDEHRIVPLDHCRHYVADRDGECKVKHEGWRYCPAPQLPCVCASMLLVDGRRGVEIWPSSGMPTA